MNRLRLAVSIVLVLGVCLPMSCSKQEVGPFPAGPGAVIPSTTTSEISADPELIDADGQSTSAITVLLRDAGGKALTTGGHSVAVSTSLGSVGAVTDSQNGTYTAVLTSETTIGDAVVAAEIAGAKIDATATVQFEQPRSFWDLVSSGGTESGRAIFGRAPDDFFVSWQTLADEPVIRRYNGDAAETDAGAPALITGSPCARVDGLWVDPVDGKVYVGGCIVKAVYDPGCGKLDSDICWDDHLSDTSALDDVFGADGDVYAVGSIAFGCGNPQQNDDGFVDPFTGKGTPNCPTPFLDGVWMSSNPGECCVFAVGANQVHKFDGTWQQDFTYPGASTNAVFGTSAGDVFVVGNGGSVARLSGGSWNVQVTGVSDNLLDVWGTAPNNMFAVGALGTVIHFDGTRWTRMDSQTAVTLRSIWGTSPDTIYAVGDNGVMIRHVR